MSVHSSLLPQSPSSTQRAHKNAVVKRQSSQTRHQQTHSHAHSHTLTHTQPLNPYE